MAASLGISRPGRVARPRGLIGRAEVGVSTDGRPARQGLYDPANEHDACGVGFVAQIKNRKSHAILANGIRILNNLAHRGAVGADPLAGDGAGILIQLPDKLFREETKLLGFELPAPGHYGVGMVFLPRHDGTRRLCEDTIARLIAAEGRSSWAGATCRWTVRS